MALEKTLGIVATASQMVSINRATHYHWLNTDPEYKEQVDELQNLQLDFVESKLFENIKDNDTTAIIFYMNKKGQPRGYSQFGEGQFGDVKIKVEFRDQVLEMLQDASFEEEEETKRIIKADKIDK